MTVEIKDISTSTALDHEARTTIRGGVAQISAPFAPSPWDVNVLPAPSMFPSGFPFNDCSPTPTISTPTIGTLTPQQDPRLQ